MTVDTEEEVVDSEVHLGDRPLEEVTVHDHMAEKYDIPFDTGWAWMVVLGSFLMHVLLMGYIMAFGILFVEIQDLFQLTSSKTAWITSTMQLVFNFFSPISNILCDNFSSRVVVMVGGFLQALSLLISAFAPNVNVLIITAGVLFGIGSSMSYGPTVIMVGFYFKRRLALANSISLSGSSIGGFVFPPLITLLIQQYSLRGSFIMLAGIIFNITLAGALLHPLKYCKRKRKPVNTKTDTLDLKEKKESELLTKSDQDVRISSMESSRMGHFLSESNLIWSRKRTVNNKLESQSEIFKKNGAQESAVSESYLRSGLLEQHGGSSGRSPRFETLMVASNGDLFTSARSLTIVEKGATPEKGGHIQTHCAKCFNRPTWKKCLVGLIDFRLLKKPVFLLFVSGCTMANFGCIALRYIPARAKDFGISEHQRALLLSVVGVTDLIVRLALGFLADTTFVQRYIHRYRLLATAMLILGLCNLLSPFAVDFTGFLIFCILFGISGGCYWTMISVSLVDLLGRDNLSRAWGIMLLSNGLMSLMEPLILGNLRDLTGSYDMSFRACGVSFTLASILIFCEQFALTYQGKSKKMESRSPFSKERTDKYPSQENEHKGESKDIPET